MNTNKHYDVAVIDYNTGNVDSVIKAVQYFQKKVVLTKDREIIQNSKRLILPGQGSFHYGIKQLKRFDLIDLIKDKVLIKRTPILGICLGMQLFADFGYEKEKTNGLGLLKGSVKKMKTSHKLPHIGWNEVKLLRKDSILNDLENNKDFYFVHSYYFDCLDEKDKLAITSYNFVFPSIVKKDNVIGFQFHPEKSLKNGLKLIDNFLKI